ncbi:MAG TPA: ATP-grasp domain-containing protein [Myxococcales bacterium]|nr:ATP-grasp domain-containing protein [Myxococcales bacterium]
MRPCVAILLPQSSYRGDDLLAAAAKLGVDVVVASDRCHVLSEQWTEGSLPLDFTDPDGAARGLADAVRAREPKAVLGTDDQTAVIAAKAARLLGLPHDSPESVEAARNKRLSRERLRAAGIPVPWFRAVELEEPIPPEVPFPCVVKPLVLSASRGVIRADDPASLRAALERVARLLRSPQVAMRRDAELMRVLVEEFLPGPEVALEGLLTHGELSILALFDKPDLLDGPYFEETLYVTPSRHPKATQDAVARMVSEGAAALGLTHGPVHAEVRLTPRGPRILEIAARSIGGLCGRALRFGVGVSLEELLLRHALGRAADLARERVAAGVLMLPIRRGGVLRDVRGVEEAKRVQGISDVVVTAHFDEELVPLPEGASYLGFAFARGETPEEVESALRRAGSLIEPVIDRKLPTARPG